MNYMKLRCHHYSFIMWLLFLILCSACEHRPLETPYPKENLFVKIYFDENIRNVNYGFYDETKKRPEYNSPQLMRIIFCDQESDKLITERYLHECGVDEKGYYIQGFVNVPNGRYNVMAYNFDTKYIKVENNGTYSNMVATTEYLTESEENRIFKSRGENANADEPIYRQPDHLFVSRIEDFEVNTCDIYNCSDTLKTAENKLPTAESIVKTYYMQFNVKGVEYVRSAVALISGMAASKNMHTGEMVMDHVASIYFGLNNGKENNLRTTDGNENTVAYASFNTFGKLPYTEGYIDITFEFNTVYNTVQTETFRVTDMFETDEVKEKQWIIIDKIIEIVPPEGADIGGGMSPGVSEWKEIEGSITI